MTEKELIALERDKVIDTYRKPFLERICPEGGYHVFEEGECVKCGQVKESYV